MNKKGFLSTSVIYSFFVVFLMVMLLMLVQYNTTKNLYIKEVNKIKTETLNSNVVNISRIFSHKILNDNGGSSFIKNKSNPNLSNPAKTNEGIFASKDQYGTSYYFRGAVNNNWVIFGKESGKPIYWRIVRINGDDSVRLIYSGTKAPIINESIVMVGSNTTIGQSRFTSTGKSAEHLGFMHTTGEERGHSISSAVKLVLENWYSNNLLEYNSYISDNIFCNDRNFYDSMQGTNQISGLGNPESGDWYSETRVWTWTFKEPSLKCLNKEDAFTTFKTSNGNGLLNYPVGLITEAEVWLAGATNATGGNANFYLYNGQNVLTMTPGSVKTNEIYITRLHSSGYLTGSNSTNNDYVRPVISLTPDIYMIGSGKWNDPYRLS